MKKIVFLAVLLLAAAAPSAWAEQKLLITDILDAGQMEFQATFEQSYQAGDLLEKMPFIGPSGAKAAGSAMPVGFNPGRVTRNSLESNYSMGIGLGHGLEVTASIPYIFSERAKAESLTGVDYERKQGFGDFAIGGKYLLYGGEHKPVSVVTGFDVKCRTAHGDPGKAGTATIDMSPYVAASTEVGHHVKPYAIYRATLRNNGGEDTHTVSLGTEVELNHTVTFDAKIEAAFNNASEKGRLFLDLPVRGYELYSFELASYLQVAHNLYVIPAVKVTTTGSTDTRDNLLHFASATGIGGALSLYYLY